MWTVHNGYDIQEFIMLIEIFQPACLPSNTLYHIRPIPFTRHPRGPIGQEERVT